MLAFRAARAGTEGSDVKRAGDETVNDAALAAGASPRAGVLASVSVVSASVLAFEVVLTRVFAAILQYHFMFLVLSVALCGLGLGGFLAHAVRRSRELSLPLLAALLGASIAGSVLFCLRILFARFPEAYALAAMVLLVPFVLAGTFLAELFSRHAAWSGKLYAWDLAGAAGAAVAVVALLRAVPAPDACLVVAAAAALAGVLVGSPGAGGRAGPLAAFAVLAAAVPLQRHVKFLDIPAVPPRYDREHRSLADRGITQHLFTELGDPSRGTRILETRWSAFSRTDLVETRTAVGDLDYRLVYTDGTSPTPMIRWNGDPRSLGPVADSFPLCDWAFAVAPLRNRREGEGAVLSIGPGGGLDALLALHHGAQRFEGAEIDPSIPALVRDHGDFNGAVYDRPRVHVAVADGRAYVREEASRGKRYALIFSALTKTTATGAGGMLVESYVHTVEAARDYLEALEEEGLVVWVVDHHLLAARFFATALAALGREGLEPAAACRRVAVLADTATKGPYKFAVAVFRSPPSAERSGAMEEAAGRRGLSVLWLPGSVRGARLFRDVAEGRLDLDGFVRHFRSVEAGGADVSPCPDDRPFVLSSRPGLPPLFPQLAGLALAVAVGFAAIAWRWGGADRMQGSDLRFVVYFLALGAGFMLVEIPIAQKLILPLGYPTLALAVILFSLLLGGGLGSFSSQRFEGHRLRRWAVVATAAVALLALAYRPVLGWLHDGLLGSGLWTRSFVASALLLPLGFFLGSPFPSGLRLFATSRPRHVPLAWGLNGVASVVGSLAAAMGGKLLGFDAALAAGAVLYALASLLLAVGGPRRSAVGFGEPTGWRAVRDSNPRPSA